MKLQKIISVDPGNGYEVVGEIAISTTADIHHKVSQARAAQPAWSALGFKGRTPYLEKLYQAFIARKNEIAVLASREMGMPIAVSSQIDIEAGLLYMRGYIDFAQTWLAPEIVFENETEVHYLFYEPRGVAGISVPWNFPFCNFIWGVMQHLVVGNTIVFKHSEECPLTGKLLEDIVASVKLPHGVFNEVYGDGYSVGEALMQSNVDILWFTGSTPVGKHIYQIAAQKLSPVVLELGGSAPGIVFEDAPIETTIGSIFFNRYLNSGQVCDGLKRLIVHRSTFDEIVGGLKQLLTTKKIGKPQDPSTQIGPLVAERQLIALEEQVADAVAKGAKVITGGKRPAGLTGAYYEPTILTSITSDMRVWKEEVFGPVLPVVSFDSEEEAIALANDTIYGLGGYIYTADKERALRASKAINTGNISVNAINYIKAQDPFGGTKLSGIGREHGAHGLKEICSAKLVSMPKKF